MAKKRKTRGSGPHQKSGRTGWYLWVTEKNGDGTPKRREVPLGSNRDEAFKPGTNRRRTGRKSPSTPK